MLELVEGMDKQYPQMKEQKGLFMMGIEVKDMEKTAGELKKKGIEFIREPIDTANGTKIAFIKDPQGTQIELIQPP